MMTRTTAGFLVLVGGLSGGAVTAAGQELGVGPTYGSSPRSYLVDGPGLHGWVSFDLLSVLRLQASVVREWGRETDRRSFCSSTLEGEAPDDCVVEDVRSFTTITTADVSAVLMTPRLLRTRAGLGASYGSHRFDVGQEGLETGRLKAPIEGRERTLDGRGWLLLAVHDLAGVPASLRASYQRYRVDFGACRMDTWSLCEEEEFRRFTLGIGYRVF